MTPRRLRRLALLLAASAFGLVPAPGAAQGQATTSGPATRGVRIYPRAGLLAPDTYFYEYFKNFTGDGLTEWTTGYLGRAFVAGLGVEVRLGDSGAFLRGEILRSFDAWLSAGHSIETLRDLYIPPEIVTTWLDVPTTMTLTSLHVVLPTRLVLGPLEPYVLVGGGGKLYGFGDPTRDNEVEATLPNDGFTWGVDLGAGLTARLFGLRLDVQARDALSRYWGKVQQDLLYTGAVSFAVF